MNVLKLQQGLLTWFNITADSLKSLASIDNICFNLYRPHVSAETPARVVKREAREVLFYPLLRYGIVEFYGNDRYSVSPSTALCSNDKILFCSIPWKPDDRRECLFDSQLAIEVYKTSGDLLFMLNSRNIDCREFSLFRILERLPSLEAIINSWVDDVLIDPSAYMFLGKTGWMNESVRPEKGIFRKSELDYSQRVLKMSETKWKQIPSRMINPDGFALAYLWAQESNNVGVVFNRKTSVLQITSGLFPMLIERLLLINTLLSGFTELNFSNREYFVKQKEFDLLNTLFGNKFEAI